jgi:phage/plasmid-like protein (TIGR03299 family)
MSDNINIVNGKAAFFTAKQPAWHGLGTVTENALTAEQAIKIAKLDFNVVKAPNYAKVSDKWIKNPTSFSTVRTDTNQILGTVGNIYKVVQNTEAFDFFTDFTTKEATIFETAGALGNGETIFITAKIPKILVIGKNDEVEEYLVLSNSHDGSGKIKVLFTPIRVVCNNTLNMALSNYRMKVEIKHTNSVTEKLKAASNLLGIHKTSMENRQLIFNLLSNSKVEDKLVYDFINYCFLTKEETYLVAMNNGSPFTVDEISTKKKNIIHSVRNYYHTGPGQDMDTAKGTAWGAINAITGYYQNVKNYVNDSDKLLDIIDGTASTKVNAAYNKIYQLVTNN